MDTVAIKNVANCVGHNHVWRVLDDKAGPNILINDPASALDGLVLMSNVRKNTQPTTQQQTLRPVLSGAHF